MSVNCDDAPVFAACDLMKLDNFCLALLKSLALLKPSSTMIK